MPTSRAQEQAFKELKLNDKYFMSLLLPMAEAEGDFDVYLMENGVMPVLLQGLDALSRHVDKLATGGEGSGSSRQKFNPLTWLAQYLLRNHPLHTSDHRDSMYQHLQELAAVERGRRNLLRRMPEFESAWMLFTEGHGLSTAQIEQVLQQLDTTWNLEGEFVRCLPSNFVARIPCVDPEKDLLRVSAFDEAAIRRQQAEQEALEALERQRQREATLGELGRNCTKESGRRAKAKFETVCADAYLNPELSQIMIKGAVLAYPMDLKGEHIILILQLLRAWGHSLVDDEGNHVEQDEWDERTKELWIEWRKAHGPQTLGCIMLHEGGNTLGEKDSLEALKRKVQQNREKALLAEALKKRRIEEEHGLIAGYADSGFGSEWQGRLRKCIEEIEAQKDLQTAIDTSLRKAGLEAYHINYSTPLGYTLAEARRADSREALVLAIASNWSATKAPAKFSWGVGIGRPCRTVHWLSRDVFVVFLDAGLAYGASARAWLRAYLGGISELRRGVLRQAVVLQIKNGVSSLLLDVEGINGMVPNQDLVNSYTVSARATGVNGGVHSSHAPFLELQVPAFSIRGVNKKGDRGAVNLASLTVSIEGLVRCMSNALQQLHHSFNFYFFTGPSSHISNGFYLYPVFAMQLLLISFLGTADAYRDIRSLLVGLGAVFAISAASGSTMLLLALKDDFVASRPGWPERLVCARPGSQALGRREIAQTWLAAGFAVAAAAAVALRRYAFAVYSEEGAKLHGVQLPCPLWEAVRVASGFALLAVLAPAARDYKCVGGMLFPVFCFAYWPFLMLTLLIAGVLPAQKVEDDAVSLSQLRLQILLVISLLMAGIVGGVVWRSYSSHGLGELQW
eukprot:g30008.t1